MYRTTVKRFILLSFFVTPIFGNASSNNQTSYQKYSSAVAWFDAYREEKIRLIESRTGGYRLPSAPYSILHHDKTRYAVVLIHGLSDSPYYMKDIAQALFGLGLNVVTVLLPGHGVNPEDLKSVTYPDWILEVRKVVKMAKGVGDNVLLGGFSTGGALSVNEALNDPSIKGQLLFAPALRLNNLTRDIQFASCSDLFKNKSYQSSKGDTPVKYQERALNGVCQLYGLIENLLRPVRTKLFESDLSVLKNLARRIRIPTFLAVTQADNRLDTPGLVAFGRNLNGPHKIIYFADEDRPNKIGDSWDTDVYTAPALLHSQFVLENNEYTGQKNPYFYVLANALREFMEIQYPDSVRSRAVED